MNRRTAREKAFQILFQIDLSKMDLSEAMENMRAQEITDKFIISLVDGVSKNLESIDKMISDRLENWTLPRIAAVERSILRIAVFEMHYMDDIPKNVSINEAVELGNKFGDEKSGKFINGVLSKF